MLQFKPKGQVFATNVSNQWSIKRDMIKIMPETSHFYKKQDTEDKRYAIHVAVLDSGIRPDHPVLNGFNGSYKDYDCVGEEGVDPGIDTNGHGTFIAGIICNLLKDVKHMIKISIIKITGTDGVLHFPCLKSAYDLLETRDELQDVFLICQASGFPETPDLEYRLKDKVTGKRSLICAASNEGKWLPSNIAWPAKEAVAVGSCDEYAQRSGFSPQGQDLLVLAPGSNIVSANFRYLEEKEEEYSCLSGTSFAAPWVTALLAHFHLQLPHRYPGNIRFQFILDIKHLITVSCFIVLLDLRMMLYLFTVQNLKIFLQAYSIFTSHI